MDSLENTPENFYGGQTEYFSEAWAEITSDPWVLSNAEGIKIPLIRKPIQTKIPRPYALRGIDHSQIDKEILRMLALGIIEITQFEAGQWVSPIFAVEKSDGSLRIILDLTEFNKLIPYQHFKMHNLTTATELMTEGCYMASLDLKDAYYSFAVKESDRKYLKFVWRGVVYQYRVIPNGICCAPRVFTKLLAPIFVVMHKEGHIAFPYIDDTWIVSRTYDGCWRAVVRLAQLFDMVGLVVHPLKSHVIPSNQVEFLGLILNSLKMQVALTDKKVEKFLRVSQEILDVADPTIRQVSGLIGMMNAYSLGIEYGGAHIKSLEIDKNVYLAQAQAWDATMVISESGKRDIEWWRNTVTQSYRNIRNASPDMQVTADASLEGWGAHLPSIGAIGGRWMLTDLSHINVLELKALLLALESLDPDLIRGKHIHLRTDNTTALNYIRKMGGVKSSLCNYWARKIWRWAEKHDVWLTISHVPGKENTTADRASRCFKDNLEWEINPKHFDKACRIWGVPKWDLFASRQNAKCRKYCSWKPDPGASHVDAFTMDWTGANLYAFPPFSLVQRVLNKARDEPPQRLILVTPTWPSRPWFVTVGEMARRQISIGAKPNNLLPANPERAPKRIKNTGLTISLI